MSESDNPGLEPAGGRYHLLSVIAQGDTGVVYRAMDTTLGWEVAVKALHERFAPDSAAARQFTAAARIMGRLQHPNTPPVHDIGTSPDGRPFFAMRLIRGRTVQELLDERPDYADGRFVAVFEPVCQTIGYSHVSGVTHGALRPEHVLIGAFGEVQVIGWGAAQVFDRSSSEQANGVVAGCRSDVFSLGRMLCTILTGSGGVERLDGYGADPGMVTLAKRCLSPDPAGRPPDACAVAARIAELRRGKE